ncbi:MAG: hypothetical protein J6B75_05620 [Ruminococcus sp.]|nr:hypothetical protein [Ruminococcus sp.]
MKKFLLILCSVFLLTGCIDKTSESSLSDINSEPQTELQTETPTESKKGLPVTEIAENIKLYDLTFPENKEYLQNHEEFSDIKEYEMSMGKISEENGNIYLENPSGERTALIELPVESETVYVTINCIIDDSRFAYNIIQEDASLGCGVYNLANGEDFRIESADRCHYFPQKVSGDYLILKRGFIADFYGYSKLNLKTFELTDIDLDFIENKHYFPDMAFSSDMKMTADITKDYDSGEYTVTLFSLENEEVIDEYKFSSENNYINFDLEFVSDNKLYIYAHKEGDSEFNYLYAVDIPTIPELNDWQKAYKQALSDFMGSDEYFSGSDIIEHSAFSIYDLNTDGTPELIISEDTSHAGVCHIYTYDNGLISLGKMGSYGDIGYYEDNGTIVHYNLGQGIEYEIFNRLENDQINIIANFYNDVGYRGEDGVYKFNDTEITKDEYDAKLAEYRGTEFVSLGRDYSFDEIDTALTEYSRIISVSRASELLWLNLPESDNRHISYDSRKKFDDKTYYIFRSYEDYDDRRVTTGWYAVDIFTGDCFDTNGLTELTPLINKEKNFSYKVTSSGGVEIYLDDKLYQTLDVTIDDTFLDYESEDLVEFIDYNFDGYNDIAVEERLGATNAAFRYFRYDPDTEHFENWSELDELHFYVKVNSDKTLSVHSKSSAVDAEEIVYKWAGEKLVPVSAEKRYLNSEGIFIDHLEYDDNGNETLVKREQLITDENGDISDMIDVTP